MQQLIPVVVVELQQVAVGLVALVRAVRHQIAPLQETSVIVTCCQL